MQRGILRVRWAGGGLARGRGWPRVATPGGDGAVETVMAGVVRRGRLHEVLELFFQSHELGVRLLEVLARDHARYPLTAPSSLLNWLSRGFLL